MALPLIHILSSVPDCGRELRNSNLIHRIIIINHKTFHHHEDRDANSQSSVDTSSSSTLPHLPPNAVIPKDPAPSAKGVSNGPSLGRSILEAFGKEILELVSDQFLDLAMELRLKAINIRGLLNLLAKAERLGYSETDIIDDEEAIRRVQKAHEGSRSCLDAIGASQPPGMKISHARSDCTALSLPSSPIEEFREPKRLKAI